MQFAPVTVVGPGPAAIGGMATVVRQIIELADRGNWPLAFLPFTERPSLREGQAARVYRHLTHTIRLLGAIRSHRSRILHVHTCSGATFFRTMVDAAVSRLLGCSTILHVHGAQFDEFFDHAGLVVQRIIRGALESADAVVALSTGWKRTLIRIAPAARVWVIENAVGTSEGEGDCDTSSIASSGAARGTSLTARREDRGIGKVAGGGGPVRFVTLARLDRWKGIDDLLIAASKVFGRGTAIELVIAGPPGSAYSTDGIQTRIHALGLEKLVRYVGTVVGREKSAAYQSAHVYVQASHAEGLPVSVLEAMAFGLPVVATAVGATAEFVEDGIHGLLVPPHDPDALAAAMERLAGEGELRKRMASANLSLARGRFGLDRFSRNLEELYGALTASRLGLDGAVGTRPWNAAERRLSEAGH